MSTGGLWVERGAKGGDLGPRSVDGETPETPVAPETATLPRVLPVLPEVLSPLVLD